MVSLSLSEAERRLWEILVAALRSETFVNADEIKGDPIADFSPLRDSP